MSKTTTSAAAAAAEEEEEEEREASGSQAGFKEHDYIGMSQQQQQQQQPNLSVFGKGNEISNLSIKELHLRRTELHLGLPGSPQDDEANGLGTHKPLVKSNGYEQDKQQPRADELGGNVNPQRGNGAGSSSSSSSCHLKSSVVEECGHDCVEKAAVAEDAAGSQSRAPVGWPPVQSFRKNSLNTPVQPAKIVENPSSPAAHHPPPAGTSTQQPSSQFVKVYMDGVPIGRKVNLRTHSSYEKLSVALEEMFRRFISGQTGTSKAMKEKLLSESKKFNFIYGSDYVLTYEDKDGDLMLVGDVPWLMFVGTVKRLRIMKGSEAIGLAPREQQVAAAAAAAAK